MANFLFDTTGKIIKGIFSNIFGMPEVGDGLWTCIVGLKVSAKYMIKPTVTLHYPDQQWVMYKNTRNWLRLAVNEETGEDLCTACGSCVRACPCSCIRVTRGEKAKERKGFTPDIFEIDFGLCCFCGLCVESCPFNAIVFCEAYEMAEYDRENFIWDKKKLTEIKDDFRRFETKKTPWAHTFYMPQWKDNVDKYEIP